MAQQNPDVTDAELSVLQVLWERKTATIRQITEVIYPNGTTSHYATVQKLLERLENKGCVSRDRTGSVHQFTALIDRDILIGHQLREMADRLCDGSLAPLLTHLVGSGKLSENERKSLRNLVDKLETENQSSRD